MSILKNLNFEDIIRTLVKHIESKLTPRSIDGRYIPYQVQDLADEMLVGKPLVSPYPVEDGLYIIPYSKKELEVILADVSFDELCALLIEADRQDKAYLVNAFARNLVHKNRKRVEQIVEDRLASVPLPIHIYFRKHLKLIPSWDCDCGPQREYSIADYITEKPERVKSLIPTKADFDENEAEVWITSFDGITSLYGIQFLDAIADLSYTTLLNIRISCDENAIALLSFSSDPDFPKRPLEKFKNLKEIVVVGSWDVPLDLWYGLNKLKTIEIMADQLPETLLQELSEVDEFEFKTTATEIPDNFFRNFKALKQLTLSAPHAVFSHRHFEGLLALEKLCLSFNDSDSLQEGLFSSLRNLKEFEMAYSGLSALPQNIFKGLNKLELIDLRMNHLKELPPEIFNGLSKLQKLYLYRNDFRSLEERLFHGLENLEVLGLGNGFLEELPPHIFDDLGNLKRLDLFANALEKLPENIFSKLKNLEYLNLENNALQSLPENIFQGVSEELQELNLEGNQLSELPEGVFKGMDNLERLNLSYNQLTMLPYDIFSDLVSLSHLDLSDNYMHYGKDFVRLPLIVKSLSITTLDPVIDEGILWKRYLEEFSISGKLRRLDEHHFKYLRGLKVLSLRCEEVTLPPNFPELVPNLERLNLNGTRIKGKSKKDIEKWFAKHPRKISF